MDEDKPAEMPTVQMAATPDWAVKLFETVNGMRIEQATRFDAIDTRLSGLEGTDKTLADAVNRLDLDVRDVRASARQHDEEIRRLSDRTKDTSKNASSADMALEAAQAKQLESHNALVAKVDSLTSSQDIQLAILTRLDKVASNPTVKVIAGMMATAFVTWLTVWLSSHGVMIK